MTFSYGKLSVYYERRGAGKNLLLLHGWGGCCESWLPLLRDSAGVFQMTALDFPGHGRSDEPDTPWSITEYMEMTAALIKELGMEGTDIVAHSFGGRVALLLAATHPELVGKLVLTGCAGLIAPKSFKQKARGALYRALKRAADNPLTRAVLGAARAEGARARLQERFGSRDYKALSPAMRKTFSRVVTQDLRGCLPNIRAATLLIWGAADAETPLWMGRVMEKEIPDAGLIVWEGAGHFAYLERFQDFRVIVEKFLL